MEVIECIANVSTAAGAVVASLGDAARSAGASLLDVHTDADHNRSVLTLAAAPDVAGEAAAALAAGCVELVDLRLHRGVHPRLGGLDVCPFVPLGYHDREAGLAAALDVARRTGAEFAALGVPAFAYDRLSPTGVTLPEVRREAFGGLQPTWGPSRAHPSAGATAIGVRDVLVAFNVDLVGADLAAARAIATAVRESGGGLPGVRALGLELAGQGRVQVSMNLTRPWDCGVGGAFDAVASAATARSVGIGTGELVGLVPAAALTDASDAVLDRCDLTRDRTLEAALTSAGLRDPDEGPLDLPVLRPPR